jgi:hypothetical protein
MAIVEADISISVDGFVAGPNTGQYPVYRFRTRSRPRADLTRAPGEQVGGYFHGLG